MEIFVTGATGTIGFQVAQALRRAGHEVWGLTRSEAKARQLAGNEIHPVVGSLQTPASYAGTAERCSVIVHAAADMQSDMAAVDKAAVEALLAASRRGPQPKTFIYTSGVWVHGATGARLEDETSVLDPTPAVAWRPAVEQLALKAPGVNALVLRPGCVYGKSGGLTGMWFGSAVKDKAVKAVGDGANRWAMVHVDDLADAYLRAVESGLGGLVFDIVDRSRATVREMAEAAARAAGVPGKVDFIPLADAKKSMGPFAEALALDQHIDARRAVRLLGWQPKHGGFADGAETYFAAWRAAQG